MSNKPKGVEIHPNNIEYPGDIRYRRFINHVIERSRKSPMFFGKHVGSKRPKTLVQRVNGR